MLNHDVNTVLGRVSNGTLLLSEMRDGSLAFTCQLDRKRQSHVDTFHAVRRRDLTEMSFGFNAPESGQQWKDGKRYLTDIDLFDVSPVVYPAYGSDSTSVQARMEARAAAVQVRSFLELVAPKVQLFNARALDMEDTQVQCPACGYKFDASDEDEPTDEENRMRVLHLGAIINAEEHAVLAPRKLRTIFAPVVTATRIR